MLGHLCGVRAGRKRALGVVPWKVDSGRRGYQEAEWLPAIEDLQQLSAADVASDCIPGTVRPLIFITRLAFISAPL